MDIHWTLITNFAIAMLAIVNPIEKIPLWVAAAKDEKFTFQWSLATLVIVSCACILLFFLWLGKGLLIELNVDLASFKIGGGLILLQFGFSMMKGTAVDITNRLPEGQKNFSEKLLKRYQQIFIPIGVPVIAGPGAITTMIIYGHQSQNWLDSVMLSITVILVLGLLLLTLICGGLIVKITGTLPLHLISRVFGLILIAISIQFMIEGLRTVFPAWVS